MILFVIFRNKALSLSRSEKHSTLSKTQDILIFRVEEYIRSGKNRNIDPNPNRLHTKRKQLGDGGSSSKDPANADLVASAALVLQAYVNYPKNGWGCWLPTTFWKAKTFLEDKHLCDIVATCDQQCCYLTAKCCHSYRKKKPPHQLKLALYILEVAVVWNSSYIKHESSQSMMKTVKMCWCLNSRKLTKTNCWHEALYSVFGMWNWIVKAKSVSLLRLPRLQRYNCSYIL